MLPIDLTVPLDNLKLVTKTQSYQFGRRLYSFQSLGEMYWLKYHEANTDPEIECAFHREIQFYQNVKFADDLLPYQIVEFEKFPSFSDLQSSGLGLILVDTYPFLQRKQTVTCVGIRQKIEKILDVLESLHQAGWIHGDLKAEHFRLYENTCRLIDFEQAMQQGHSSKKLTATPHYMAPELFQGAAKSIQSDLYALGIVLFEWLTQTKLQATTYYDWAMLHCQKFQLRLPVELQYLMPLLCGLLEKRIERRFSSIVEVRNCLY